MAPNVFAPARGGNAISGCNNALPPTFKCAIDGAWLTNTEFSNKQLAKWQTKKRSPNDGVTPANIGLICKSHSGAPSSMMQCAGPCGMLKSRNDFSGAQRRTGGRWCKDCIEWKERQDWDSIPTAAPNEANDAEDEREDFLDNHDGLTFRGQHDDDDDDALEFGSLGPSNAVNDDAAVGTDGEDDVGTSVTGNGHYFEADSDDDSDGFMMSSLAPATKVSAPMSPVATNTGGTPRVAQLAEPSSRANTSGQLGSQSPGISNNSRTGSSSTSQPAASTWVPPHLRVNENLVTLQEKNLTGNHIPGPSQASSSTSTTSGWVPPHLRVGPFRPHSGANTTATASNVSRAGPSAQSVASSDSRAGIPTLTSTSRVDTSSTSRGNTGRVYNAYDPSGTMHQRVADRATTENSMSVTQSAGPSSTSDRQRPARGNGKWARPDQ